MKNKLNLILLIILFSLTIVNGDIISINAGGNNEIQITSDIYTEGFYGIVSIEQTISEENITPSITPTPSQGGNYMDITKYIPYGRAKIKVYYFITTIMLFIMMAIFIKKVYFNKSKKKLDKKDEKKEKNGQ